MRQTGWLLTGAPGYAAGAATMAHYEYGSDSSVVGDYQAAVRILGRPAN